MTLDADPYRTLGLARGATLDEVKRAYRRLAKANHPDAAGAAALPRFLAIQAAYEQLAGGTGPARGGRRSPGAPRRPWDADPDRSDATRRAYGYRGRSTAPGTGSASENGATTGRPAGAAGPMGTGNPTGAGAGAADGASATGGSGATNGTHGSEGARTSWSRRTRPAGGAAGSAGGRPSSASDGGSADPTGGSSRRRTDRPRNKATLGSTSYDGVDGPFEPDWGGASWYGTTSGTYWTLNPKEYADPRKHGPEYQARARRTARSRPPGPGRDPGPAMNEGPTAYPGAEPAPDPQTGDPGEPVGTAPAGPTHTTTSWWESTAGRAADPDPGAAAPTEHPRSRPAPPPPPPDVGRALADIARALTDVHYGGPRGRVVRAVIGWLPIALGLGWLIGELTGCGRFSASCDGSAGPIGLALQLAILALLLAVPVLASLTTMASLTVFAASLVAALILSATGSAADGDSRRAALGFVLVVAWLVGFAVATWRRWRTIPASTGPVS